MQLTGDQFTSATAIFGNDLVTLPDFPQANGLPYATINIPAGLAPGTTSASVAISFANPTNARISYTTKRYAVNF